MGAGNGEAVRRAVWEAIREEAGPKGDGQIGYHEVLKRVQEGRSGGRSVLPEPDRSELPKAVLAYWNRLLQCGALGFSSPGHFRWNSEVFHLSDVGRETLAKGDSDPINPDGYMSHLQKTVVALNPVSTGYIQEALHTYGAGCYRATAVMVGTAAEGMILSLRDALVKRFRERKRTVSRDLQEWRIKRVTDAIAEKLEEHQGGMPPELFRRYNVYWPGFTAHIRAVRNASGHPNDIDPITPECVHAALLILPEFGKLALDLEDWVRAYTF